MATVTLNPYAAHDPSASLKTNQIWHAVWKTALIVSIVAFTALGVLAMALTMTYWPEHLLIVSLLLFAGALPASGVPVNWTWKKSDQYAEEVRIDSRIKQLATNLDAPALSKKLYTLGVRTKADEKIQRTLLARFLQIKEEEQNLRKHAEQIFEESEPSTITIASTDFDNPKEDKEFERLQGIRLERENLLRSAALCNVKAAYCLHLLQNPKDMKMLQDYVQITTSSFVQHLIAEHYGDNSAHAVIKFGKQSYTKSQLLEMSATKLAQKVFGLRSWYSLMI